MEYKIVDNELLKLTASGEWETVYRSGNFMKFTSKGILAIYNHNIEPPQLDMPVATMPRIIALCGKMKSGKTTSADILKKYGYIRRSFAEPLKEAVKHIFGFTESDLKNKDEPAKILINYQLKPRTALQFVGTEMFQHEIQKILPIGRDLWALRLLSSINDSDRFVIDDLRFEHEFQVLIENFPQIKIIKIVNPFNETISDHESEKCELQCNRVIINDSTIAALHMALIEAIF